jgi:hypothetical protein
MDVGKLLSRWWFVALASLAVGISSTWLVHLVFPISDPLMMSGDPPALRLLSGTFFALAYGGGYAFSLTSLLLAFVPRHKVGARRIPGPDDLERSGLKVVRRRGSYDVRMTSISTLRVYEDGPGLRCLPAPNALWAIALLSFAPQLSFLVVLVVLSVHHQCFKGLGGLTVNKPLAAAAEKADVDHLVQDSLMNAFALAKNAAEVRRSTFHDRAIIMAVISLIAWAVLLMLNAGRIVDDGRLLGFQLGTLAITVLATAIVLLLWKRSCVSVKREEAWAARLQSVMRGDEREGSPVAVLLDACQEVPSWLALRREGVWVREPGRTLLVFILLTMGTNAFLQYGSIWWGFRILGIACLASGIYMFAVMRAAARHEAQEMAAEWEGRMKEMDSLLEPQGRR